MSQQRSRRGRPKRKKRKPRFLRKNVRLGPMGGIPAELILYVTYSPTLKKHLQSIYGAAAESDLLVSFDDEVNRPLQQRVEHNINSLAPSDTHTLANAIIDSIQVFDLLDTTNDYSMEMEVLESDAPYGAVVKNMPTEWVKHPGNHAAMGRRTRSPTTGAMLNDPKAKKGWWDDILRRSRNDALALVVKWKRNYVTKTLDQLRRRALIYGDSILSTQTPITLWADQLIRVRTR